MMQRRHGREYIVQTVIKILCLAVFAVASTILALKHEPWFDEARAWELAKVMDLNNFQEILSNEGHPILWYLFLMPFARLGYPYAQIPFISTSVMVSAAGLLLFYPKAKSLGNLLLRCCLILSPVCLYFYSAISRSYCLAALLLILTSLFFEERREHPFRLNITVALLLQTHVFLAGFCFGVCVVELAGAVINLRKDRKKSLMTLLSLVIPFLSAMFYFVEFRYIFEHRILTSGAMGMEGFLFPFFVQLFFLMGTEGMYFLVASFLLTAVFMVILFYRSKLLPNPAGIIVFLTGCIGFAVICHFYSSDSRGYFLLGYFGLFMFENLYTGKKAEIKGPALSVISLAAAVLFFAGMWTCHFKMPADDLNYSFSDAKGTAEAVNTLPQDSVIYDYCACPGETVLPYLNEGKVLNTIDGHVISDDITFWNERQTEFLKGVNPTQYIKESRPELTEIYVLYPLTENPTFPSQYRNEEYLSNGYEYEIIYRSPEDVFYFDGLERMGIMKITFPANEG